ncbi:hypothetical protein BE21_50785 [Sorangium cellulosum]|uniref:Uncharacterized protein n=1 Tax=Sorangium cellulosum TaxID=56 RepID=A0A150TG33_SORCE|nr:hypothetical protein BE21_50785 [Sorangium cellulosum]
MYASRPASFRRRAWSSVSMPRVQHASRPSPFTPRTMSRTRSKAGPSFTSRHAAPMQNLVEPPARARSAAARTAPTSSMRSGPTSVS